jgi:hypothetical protein
MKLLCMLTGIALLATACASESGDEAMAPTGDAPAAQAGGASTARSATAQAGQINCATAEADLRVLRAEQSHAMERAMGGGTTMVPSGLVTEPEFSTGPMGAGQYSDYLNNRISQIQQTCGL